MEEKQVHENCSCNKIPVNGFDDCCDTETVLCEKFEFLGELPQRELPTENNGGGE